MWLWWIMSLVILAASIVFALYIFYSNYKVTPVKKDDVKEDSRVKKYISITRQPIISSLKLKLETVEHNSMLYNNELKKLQERIQTLEKDKGIVHQKDKADNADENWEELYYQIHETKEKMESELDLTGQKLDEAESLVNELRRREKVWKEKRSELENELSRMQPLQNKIEELQRTLEGAAEREMDLQQQLEEQKELYKDIELLQQRYATIQSEADELRNRIQEINNRDILLQQKINRLAELESNMEISEYEKTDIKKILEEIIIENVALATKLQELQEKLSAEKLA